MILISRTFTEATQAQLEEDPALARLKALAASHKALEEEPSADIFGDWQDK